MKSSLKTAILLLLVFFIPFGFAQIRRGETIHLQSVFAFQKEEKQTESVSATAPLSAALNRAECISLLSKKTGKNLDESLFLNLNDDRLRLLAQAAQTDSLTDEVWHSVTGCTLNALLAYGSGKIDGKWLIDKGSNGQDNFTLGFIGDLNFTEEGYVMPHAKKKKNKVTDCIDSVFKTEMQNADILLANNEFPYSEKGTPTKGKQYTFRAKPDSAQYLGKLGIDLVSLGNNHAYDYGIEAFADTLSALRKVNIPYVGAGKSIEEASHPVCFLINGYKVAYLAASRAEDLLLTPGATEKSSGIFECYDPTALTAAVKSAAAENDFVIVYVHWGIEYSYTLSDNQMRLARQFIDAGATAVIGAHPHVLQGMEFYKGAPIAYSLGNFWFNTRSLETGLLKLNLRQKDITLSFVPGLQSDSETHAYKEAEDRRKLFDLLQDISPNGGIRIDDNGVISPKGTAS